MAVGNAAKSLVSSRVLERAITAVSLCARHPLPQPYHLESAFSSARWDNPPCAGFTYCTTCSDHQALVARTDGEPGYDSVPVCAYCIPNLTSKAPLVHEIELCIAERSMTPV